MRNIVSLLLGNNGHKKAGITGAEDINDIINQEDTDLVNCMVIVEQTQERTYPRIAKSMVPSDSLERKYRGQPYHLLGLDMDKKLWAIEPDNELKKNESPKDCFIALQYEKEVSAIYSLSEGMIEKIKIGLFIALCIVELIVLFLIITAASGGSVG